MVLIRIITLQGLIHNVRIYARHVKGVQKGISDALSRQKWDKFRKLTNGRVLDKYATEIPEQIWPISKIWFN